MIKKGMGKHLITRWLNDIKLFTDSSKMCILILMGWSLLSEDIMLETCDVSIRK